MQSSDDEADDPAQIEEVASGTDEPADEAAYVVVYFLCGLHLIILQRTPIASRTSTRVRKPSMKV